MHQPFTPAQLLALAAALEESRPLLCPHCATLLDRNPVPPRPDVSYVRDRLWLVCPRCHATGVLDRREIP